MAQPEIVRSWVIADLFGKGTGKDFFITRRANWIINEQPLISPYGIFEDAGPDMYFKGWALIHMIREIIEDDEEFRILLRKMNQEFYHQTVTSTEIERFVSGQSSKDLDKVFDQYLRMASLPVLEYYIGQKTLKYRVTADVEDFQMPVKIKAKRDFWIDVTTDWQELDITNLNLTDTLVVDSNFLIGVKKVEFKATNN